jgi:osmoprotectant transport system substrate-binding protein
MNARPAAAVFALLGLLAAACANDIPERDPAADGADHLEWMADTDVDLDGVELAVGSKDLPEQEILGWIAVEALRAAGADVTEEIALGQTVVTREAELAGLIDAYWEYTGTGWVAILQQGDPPNEPHELYESVRDRDEARNSISWLPPAPLNSAFSFAGRPETLDDLGVHTVDDLRELIEEEPEQATFCLDMTTDFDERPDGLPRFERVQGVTVPRDQILSLPTDELYEAVAVGAFCNFGQVFNTDPRLASGDLEVLEDDGTFVIYNPSLTVRSEVLDDVPGIEDVMTEVTAELTDEVMRELRAEVEIDGQPPRTVAREWLEEQGIAG